LKNFNKVILFSVASVMILVALITAYATGNKKISESKNVDSFKFGTYDSESLEEELIEEPEEEAIEEEQPIEEPTEEQPIEETLPEFGYIKIYKTDVENNSLANAVFGVYDAANDTKICELETDTNGTAITSLLPIGDYFLTEIKAPENYILNNTAIYVTVTADETAKITVANEKIPEQETFGGKIKIIKTDSEDNKPLANAVFGVYNAEDNTKICELETDTNGIAVTSLLPIGNYYLRELKAPDSYELSTEKYAVTIIADETVEIAITNKKIPEPEITEGKIKLIKRDAEDGKLLSNAVFGVYRVSDDVKICELETDTNGTAITSFLTIGNYYLSELKAPENYELSNEKYGVTVKADEIVEITITNKKIPEPEVTEGKIKLIKKDLEDGKLLSNAIFGVYRISDDTKICELETDINGTAVSPFLAIGEYYLQEIKAPDSYELSNEKHKITVKADETAEITLTNKKILEPEATEGKIKLIKKDADDGKLLDNAIFGVYRVSDDVKVCELETTSNGEALSSFLPNGEYYLREVKAPENYEISNEKYGVIVKADEVAKITITNKKIPEPVSTATPTTPPTSTTIIITPTQTTESNPTPIPTPAPTLKPTPMPAPTPTQNNPTGKLIIIKKAEQTSELLAGAVFGVHRVSDDVKITELTTDANGKAEMSLPTGEFYLLELKAPYSYKLEDSKIYFTIAKDLTVYVDVTNERDNFFTTPDEHIEIPKTGTTPPYLNYALALISLSVAGYFILKIVPFKKRNQNKNCITKN